MKNIENSQIIITAINRIISGYNFKHYSKYYGSFDRNFWHTKTISDFPSATYQQCILGLTKYVIELENSINKDVNQIKLLNKIIKGGIINWCNIQNSDGSQNEYYKYDRSFCPTVFTTFAISKSFLLKKNIFSKQEKILIKQKIGKSCLWISKNLYFLSCNQLLAAHNALYYGKKILREKSINKNYHILKDKIIHLYKSNKLLEYGGIDTGYLFISLDLIYEYLIDEKLDLKIINLAKFFTEYLSNFLHPDGTIGGAYNSRNTTHVMPFGSLIYKSLKTDSSYVIYEWFIKHNKKNNFKYLYEINDKYFFYFYFNSLINFHISNKNHLKKINKNFVFKDFLDPKNEMRSFNINDSKIYINLKKNSCFKFYKKNHLLVHEEGFNFFTNNRKYSSQCFSGNHIKTIINNNFLFISTKGYLKEVNDFLPLVSSIISFKFFAKYILYFNFISIFFNKYIKKKFLKKEKFSKIQLSRKFIYNSRKLKLIDRLSLSRSTNNFSYKKIKNFSETYSDSSNFFKYDNLSYQLEDKFFYKNYHKYILIMRVYSIG